MTRAGAARHDAKRDENEPTIIAALRQAGCLVEPVSKKGVPDLIVWSPFIKLIVLMEVKDGSKQPSKRKLTPDQEIFHAEWKAAGAPIVVVETVLQALEAAGYKKRLRKKVS